MINCKYCKQEFKVGDKIQAFLRSPDDEQGNWTNSVMVDSGFISRAKKNSDDIERKHEDCQHTYAPSSTKWRMLCPGNDPYLTGE